MTGIVCTPLRSEWFALRGRLAARPVRTGRATANAPVCASADRSAGSSTTRSVDTIGPW